MPKRPKSAHNRDKKYLNKSQKHETSRDRKTPASHYKNKKKK